MNPIDEEWYKRKTKQVENLPHIEVSEEEFIRLCLDNGFTEEKANFQLKMAKGLGSYMECGDKMIAVHRPKDDKETQ